MSFFIRRVIRLRVGAGLASDSARPIPLRSKKQRSFKPLSQAFVDVRHTRVTAGAGGDGCISFLQLWANENAGPDGGDGGHGAHVIFQSTSNVNDLKGISTEIRAEDGEKGFNKDCNGRNAKHKYIQVPVGTVVKTPDGKVVGDLSKEGMLMIAARGGAGGRGNHYFTSDKLQAPHVAECGAEGEFKRYILEVKTMAHIGLLGMPNAGKSTLLRAISRARPKVAPYPFTTLKPHLGVVQYDDYVQVTVADLPGLIEESHKNRGLGIQFLQHAERCAGLLYVVDMSQEEPWEQINMLRTELSAFSKALAERPLAVVANKIDLPEAQVCIKRQGNTNKHQAMKNTLPDELKHEVITENLEAFKKVVDLPVIAVSAKMGTNLTILLDEVRRLYDDGLTQDDGS